MLRSRPSRPTTDHRTARRRYAASFRREHLTSQQDIDTGHLWAADLKWSRFTNISYPRVAEGGQSSSSGPNEGQSSHGIRPGYFARYQMSYFQAAMSGTCVAWEVGSCPPRRASRTSAMRALQPESIYFWWSTCIIIVIILIIISSSRCLVLTKSTRETARPVHIQQDQITCRSESPGRELRGLPFSWDNITPPDEESAPVGPQFSRHSKLNKSYFV